MTAYRRLICHGLLATGSLTLCACSMTAPVLQETRELELSVASDARLDIDDGSASISVTDTTGVVTVDDGSGSINVDGARDFELVDDGSGSVNLGNIRNR